MKKLYGTVVPIITPLTDEDTIDQESLKRLVDHVIDNGLQCLYPCGTTGEMMYLTVEERKLIADVTVKQAAGRVPVFVHVGAWNQKDTIELAQHAVQIGADGIGVVTPPPPPPPPCILYAE
jgi:4-hydroxy-tetrahydrodipicolinate synthase